MRAVRFSGPSSGVETSSVDQVAMPEPGAGEVAIDVHAAGINFIDVMARRGDPGYAPAWPFVPGLEVAGTVRALGPEVDGLAVGQRVAAFTGGGGLAEVAVAAAALVARVPDGLALDQAAAAPAALATAALLVDRAARVRHGDAVLVHSAGGGVGQALVQRARRAGAARVIGTVGAADRVAAAARAGYDAVLVRDAALQERLADAVGGRGVDVVLDPQGTALLELDLELLAPGGRIVLFGNAAGAALGPLPELRALFAGNASIGAFSISRLAATAPAVVGGALRDVLDALAGGQLDVAPTVLDGLDAAPAAVQELADGRGAGKRVVRVRAD